jgi:putative addiction module component (TIGR02574 family)
MDLQNIESEALHLTREERAKLMQKLVLSFDTPDPEELRADWLSEAERRARELDDGALRAVPGHEVIRKARALVK